MFLCVGVLSVMDALELFFNSTSVPATPDLIPPGLVKPQVTFCSEPDWLVALSGKKKGPYCVCTQRQIISGGGRGRGEGTRAQNKSDSS